MIAVAVPAHSPSAQTPAAWLDRALSGWNGTAAAVPPPSPGTESRDALARRCGTISLKGSPAADTLSRAGWVPFLHLDGRIVRGEVEVLGGMSAAGAGCEARLFNLFVFAGGRFAGTVSPVVMALNGDGAVGAVRITAADAMTAEFARYLPGDAECCPSSRMRVTYRLDRRGAGTVLDPVDSRRIR